jgi:hypothetical protein
VWRRLAGKHWRGAEAGLAAATARMAGPLPAGRAAELTGGPVTVDIDATDVEVYGSRKRGVACSYQGQRAGRPHVAARAETEIPLAAGLLAGDQDPRSSVVALPGRALAALPERVREGARAAGRKIALRAGAGYFAGDLARAAAAQNMAFAIGAGRITTMWRALAGIADDAWRDAIGMQNAQVAVSPYAPADWPQRTAAGPAGHHPALTSRHRHPDPRPRLRRPRPKKGPEPANPTPVPGRCRVLQPGPPPPRSSTRLRTTCAALLVDSGLTRKQHPSRARGSAGGAGSLARR